MSNAQSLAVTLAPPRGEPNSVWAKRGVGFAVIAVLLFAEPASAQMLYDRGPPQHRLVHRNTISARVNPLGLLYEGRLMYRFRLYESPSMALRDNFIGLGAMAILSPAFAEIGPYIEFQPLTVLGFWATYMYSQYFRTFGLFQSFPSPNSNFSDTEIRRLADLPRTDAQANYVTGGGQLIIGADFQVKVWQIMLRSKARLVRSSYRMRAGDTVFYEQFYDVLAPNNGWFLTNDADLLWQRDDSKLFIGLRYTATTAFYEGRQYLGGEEQTNLNAMHRVGPFAAYTFRIQDGAAFNSPTVFLLAQWWLVHRYRTGAVSTQALPLLGVGFQVSGDLIPLKY